MIFLRILLFPFALLYDFITSVRNFLFDQGWKKSTFFEKPYAIVLGNLTVGGTGKTPHTEYILKLLKDTYKVAMLSRGYGRKTKGFLLATSNSTAHEIGDEPYQVYRNLQESVPVIVCEKRVEGIQGIKEKLSNTEVVVLDDAFQHRALKGHLNILISSYYQPFYNDFLLPFGRLRESRNGASRADAIIVSKSPTDLSVEEKEKINRAIYRYYNPEKPIFYSSLEYGKPYPLSKNETIENDSPCLLLTSIANPSRMLEDLKPSYRIVSTLFLNDHQEYTLSIINKLKAEFQSIQDSGGIILTTEKDAAKLQNPQILKLCQNLPIFIVPIQVQFHEKDNFHKFITEGIQ